MAPLGVVGVTGTGSLLSQTITLTGTANGSSRWAAQGFTFTANSTSATLTFRQIPFPDPSLRVHMDAKANEIGFPLQAMTP